MTPLKAMLGSACMTWTGSVRRSETELFYELSLSHTHGLWKQWTFILLLLINKTKNKSSVSYVSILACDALCRLLTARSRCLLLKVAACKSDTPRSGNRYVVIQPYFFPFWNQIAHPDISQDRCYVRRPHLVVTWPQARTQCVAREVTSPRQQMAVFGLR